MSDSAHPKPRKHVPAPAKITATSLDVVSKASNVNGTSLSLFPFLTRRPRSPARTIAMEPTINLLMMQMSTFLSRQSSMNLKNTGIYYYIY